MKTILFLVQFGSFTAFSQPYFYMPALGTYQALSGETVFSSTTPWSPFQTFIVPLGFTFQYMGTNYTSIRVEGSGFTYFDANYYHLLNPFTVQLRDRGTSTPTSLSPLSYKMEGSAPNRIGKIQWANCSFAGDTASNVNFQLWLFEGSNHVEVHMGPSTIVNPSAAYSGNGSPGPLIGLFKYTSASNCSYSLSLYGPASNPLDTNRTGNINFFGLTLNGTPSSGSIFKFFPGSLGMDDLSEEKIFFFPNPSTGTIQFNSGSAEPVVIRIYSGTGQKRYEGVINLSENFRIPEDIGSGIYFLEAVGTDAVWLRKKLILVRE